MRSEDALPVHSEPVSVLLLQWCARYWSIFLLVTIVVIGAAARTVDITGVPKGFFTDEASFGLNADLILHTGRDEHGKLLPVLFRSFGEYKLPVFIYAEVPFVAILGRTELAVRLTSAALGCLTVVSVCLLAKEVFRHRGAALASAFFLAISPWHIHYSRTGLGDIVTLPLFFSLGFYLFFRAMRMGGSVVPAAVVLALCFYCYRGGWLVLPPLLTLMGVAYQAELRAQPKDTVTAAAVFFALLLPLAVHLLTTNSDRTSQSWIFNIESDRSTFAIFKDFYRSYYTRGFLFENADNGPFLRHYLPGQGWLYWVQAPLILAGLAGMALKFNRRFFFVLALLFLYPLTASLSDTSPISSRAILGTVAFSLLSGAGFWALLSLLKALAGRSSFVLAAGLALVVGAVSLNSFAAYVSKYHTEYPRVSDGYWGWQDGPQAIVAYFQQVEGRYDQLFMDGKFNAPAIFFRFYAGDDGCRKCAIGGPLNYQPDLRQLFALRPETLAETRQPYRVLDTLFYKDGSIAFQFVEFSGPRLGLRTDDARGRLYRA